MQNSGDGVREAGKGEERPRLSQNSWIWLKTNSNLKTNGKKTYRTSKMTNNYDGIVLC